MVDIEFEIEEYSISEDDSLGRRVKGYLDTNEAIDILYRRIIDDARFVCISFDLEGPVRENYDNLIEAGSVDRNLETDNVEIKYSKVNGETSIETLDLESELPKEWELDTVYLGRVRGDYRPGLKSLNDSENAEFALIHTFNCSERRFPEIREGLVNYIEDLHPIDTVAESSETFTNQVCNELKDVERML